jgi:hypothetical protein
MATKTKVTFDFTWRLILSALQIRSVAAFRPWECKIFHLGKLHRPTKADDFLAGRYCN